MEYPEYNIIDIQLAEQDGALEISDFANFISELLEKNCLEYETEIGVAKFVSSNGTKLLKLKQRRVLELILKKHPQTECNRCGNTIELNELLNSYNNGGHCSYCQCQVEKDD